MVHAHDSRSARLRGALILRGALALLLALPVAPPVVADDAGGPEEKEPVRVFVLVGQSNMQGKGKIAHLEALSADEATKEEFAHLRDGDGWAERDDVWIKYWDQSGPLTVGYGTPKDRIGPELGFGHIVGEALDEPVLLIKVAWGGQSLARDFRPPSRGLPSEEKLAAILENTNAGNEKRGRPLVDMDEIRESYGRRYREMISEVHEVLKRPAQVSPALADRSFELAGLVWFQGFNDVINDEFRAEYGENLIAFIRDLREDLGVPKLPVVVGELGMEGREVNPRYAHKHYAVREAQEAPSKLPEFAGTVAYAKTTPYVVMEGDSFDGGYHYRGRADTFYRIGEAFGRAMLDLVPDAPKPNRAAVREAGKRWSEDS